MQIRNYYFRTQLVACCFNEMKSLINIFETPDQVILERGGNVVWIRYMVHITCEQGTGFISGSCDGW
jgi:hypothetical protein